MSLYGELKRRNVFRVGVAYLLGSWVLAQVADLLLENFEAPPVVMKSILVVLIIGFPVAVFLAWAYELTPEGVKPEAQVDRAHSITGQTGRQLDRVIIGILVAAVCLLLVDRFVGNGAGGEPERPGTVSTETVVPVPDSVIPVQSGTHPSAPKAAGNTVAVLPFVNMSSDPEQEYFSDGITEEVLNRLAGIGELKVSARTSVFSFKGKNRDVRDIARDLGVSNILEGSVRKSGEQVRITAQLIRAEDGFHLWSQSYDRKLESIFDIQDDIASQIAAALQISLGVTGETGGQVSRVVNPEVYDLYLRARALHRQRGEGLLEAIDLFQQALAIDPDFAPAWAGLAHSYIVVINYVSAEQAEELGDVGAKSMAAARKALEIDPDLPTALHAMGNNLLFSYQWAEAEKYYRRALELDPDSADVMEDYVALLEYSWQLDNARSMAERMIELDPYVPVYLNAIIAVLNQQGEFELRDLRIRQALDINPDLPNIQGDNLERLLQYGRYEEARDYAGKMNPDHYRPESTRQLIEWMQHPEQEPGPAAMEGIRSADSAPLMVDRYDLWLSNLKISGDAWSEFYLDGMVDLMAPVAAPELMSKYRSDPRTKDLLIMMRLPEYWREVGWPDQCRPLGDTDFECH